MSITALGASTVGAVVSVVGATTKRGVLFSLGDVDVRQVAVRLVRHGAYKKDRDEDKRNHDGADRREESLHLNERFLILTRAGRGLEAA